VNAQAIPGGIGFARRLRRTGYLELSAAIVTMARTNTIPPTVSNSDVHEVRMNP